MQQNKKVHWIIEPCVFDKVGKFNRYNEFLNIINKNDDFVGKNYLEPITCLSSLSTARNCGFYDKDTYYVSNYSKYLGEEFLNENYVIMPLSKLANASEFTADLLGAFISDVAFIKPNSGFKTFTGDCIDYTEVGEFCRNLLNMGVSENELCIISTAKDIKDFEFRFWIINGEIITHSAYSWADSGDYKDIKANNKMISYIERIIKDIKISAYTIDICILEDSFKVVEINNIYTSGTYNCDLEKLYIGMRKLAIQEYNEINCI